MPHKSRFIITKAIHNLDNVYWVNTNFETFIIWGLFRNNCRSIIVGQLEQSMKHSFPRRISFLPLESGLSRSSKGEKGSNRHQNSKNKINFTIVICTIFIENFAKERIQKIETFVHFVIVHVSFGWKWLSKWLQKHSKFNMK